MKFGIVRSALFIILGALPTVAAGSEIPSFDVASMCRASTSSEKMLASCLTDERAARDRLAREWDQFSHSDAASCAQETNSDGTPSYVELLTCLNMAREAKALSKQGVGQGLGPIPIIEK